jgi:DNA-binding CsgD family transcriptional regulator
MKGVEWKMDELETQRVSSKLDAIIKLMVLSLTEGKNQREQVRLLSGAGFPPKEIAETIGTTPNTVRVALSNLRRKTGKKAAPKAQKKKRR